MEKLTCERAKQIDLVTAANAISGQVEDFKSELNKPKEATIIADTRPVQQIEQKGLTDIKIMMGGQPKSIVRKFQILLFPEKDARLFYKVVFSRWFLWLAVMLFLINPYKWGIHYSDTQKEIKLVQVENDRIRKAWDYYV